MQSNRESLEKKRHLIKVEWHKKNQEKKNLKRQYTLLGVHLNRLLAKNSSLELAWSGTVLTDAEQAELTRLQLNIQTQITVKILAQEEHVSLNIQLFHLHERYVKIKNKLLNPKLELEEETNVENENEDEKEPVKKIKIHVYGERDRSEESAPPMPHLSPKIQPVISAGSSRIGFFSNDPDDEPMQVIDVDDPHVTTKMSEFDTNKFFK